MPKFGVNFISQKQLQKERYALKTVLAEIEIKIDRVMAKIIENNLYILNTPNCQFSLSSPTIINPKILKLRHL